MGDSGRHRQQSIDEPVLTRHEGRMRGAREPLRQTHNVFEPGLPGGDGERNRALNHVGVEGRAVVGALHVLERLGNVVDIAHVGDRDLGALRPQLCAASILSAHHRAHAIARS